MSAGEEKRLAAGDPVGATQQLVYGITHDMGAPLRSVVQFAGMLEQRLDERLDERERYWLQLVRDGGEQAQAMLAALLQYSRLTTEPGPLERIPLRAALDAALDALAERIEAASASIEIAAGLPEITSYPRHWQLLFHSLLDNALKFQAKDGKQLPNVQINCARNGNRLVLTVDDNGIGVAEAQWPVITTPFKRLHAEQDYPGLGMGLAYCERIAQLHAGRLEPCHSRLGGFAIRFSASYPEEAAQGDGDER